MNARLKRTVSAKNAEEIRNKWDRVAATVLTATRRHKGVSQQETADKLGWSRNMVANLESGRRVVRFGDLILISQALDTEPQTLVTRIMQWEGQG